MNLKDAFSVEYTGINFAEHAIILEKMGFEQFNGIEVSDLKTMDPYAKLSDQYYLKFHIILSAYIAKYGYEV